MISIIFFIFLNLIISILSIEELNLDISQSPINLVLNSTSSNYSYKIQASGKSNFLNFVFIESPSHIIKYIATNNKDENISGFSNIVEI